MWDTIKLRLCVCVCYLFVCVRVFGGNKDRTEIFMNKLESWRKLQNTKTTQKPHNFPKYKFHTHPEEYKKPSESEMTKKE